MEKIRKKQAQRKLSPQVHLMPLDHMAQDTSSQVQHGFKRRTLVAPWKNVAEFKRVYDWLFSDDNKIKCHRRAISQMRVWSLRRSNLCPAAVLATAVIVKVQLQDAEDSDNLQALYASAFTRFFNFMSSIMQTHNMRTMYETAEDLGLQTFVVDLRHICAHGQELPPLSVLRSTAKYCLGWLHGYYWSKQLELIRDVDASELRTKEKTQFEQDVSGLFAIYDAALECYLKGSRNLKGCKRIVHGKRFAQLKDFYESREVKELREVFDIVVKELSSLVKRGVAIKDLIEIYIESMLQMKCFFTEAFRYSFGEGLEILIDATQGLFRMLAINGFMEDVFQTLLQIVENPNVDEDKRRGASFWASQIADSFVALRKMKRMYKEELDQNPKFKEQDFSKLNTEKLPKNLRLLLIYSGIDRKHTLLFGDTTRRPSAWVFDREFIEQRMGSVNEFTAPMLKSLLPLVEPPLADDVLQSLYKLFDIYSVTYTESEDAKQAPVTFKNKDIFTATDLLQKLNDVSKDEVPIDITLKTTLTKFGIWSIVPDDETTNWATCPLGKLPWE